MQWFTAKKSDYLKATAFARGHITGFFAIYPNGSTGAGFNIEKAMKTTVTAKKSAREKITVKINGKKEKAQTSRIVAKKILKKTTQKYEVLVEHETQLPIGYGLGLSGAGALSLAIALNKSLKLKLPKKEVIEIAAKADIEAGTGLGDVYAEQYKGMILGLPPYPSKKAGKIKNNYKHAVFAFFGPISTKKIIQNPGWKTKINKTGSYCMQQINKKRGARNARSAENFLHLSRVFAIETGLATRQVRNVMEEFPNSSMAMLGNTAFVLAKSSGDVRKTEKALKKYCKKTFSLEIN